jgi:hypothetical protein
VMVSLLSRHGGERLSCLRKADRFVKRVQTAYCTHE